MGLGYKSVIILCFLSLAGCGGMPPVYVRLGGLQGSETGEIVPVRRPEPKIVTADRAAAQVARDALLAKGTAADAAVAMAFTLAVTLPSSAGLGGGGVCVMRDANGTLEGVDFRQAAFTRGLLGIHARFGSHPWSSLVASAETFARFGYPVSPALARDLATHGDRLTSDPAALAAFMTAERRLIAVGVEWRQPRLADTLARVRQQNFLGGTTPQWFVPSTHGGESERASQLGGGTTAFAVADAAGAAVGCVLTMGRPFGLGSLARDSGYLFAAQTPEGAALDQIAMHVLACVDTEGDGARACPLPAASFSLIP